MRCTRCSPPCSPVVERHEDGHVLIRHRVGEPFFFEDCDCVEFTRARSVAEGVAEMKRIRATGALYYAVHVDGRGHLAI